METAIDELSLVWRVQAELRQTLRRIEQRLAGIETMLELAARQRRIARD